MTAFPSRPGSPDAPPDERPSFRRRLLMRIGPAVVLALGVLAAIAWGGAYLTVHQSATDALATEVNEMRADVGGQDTLDLSRYAWDEAHHRLAVDRVDPIFVQVFTPDGRLVRRSANIDSLPVRVPARRRPVHAEGIWPSLHTFTLGGRSFYYRTRPLRASSGGRLGFVQVARLVPEHRSLLWGFGAALGGLWLLLSGGLMGLVAWAAGRVLRPLRSITEVARSVTSAELEERVDIPPTADRETATLGRAFNALLDRIEEHVAALRRERTPESYRETLRLLDRKLGGLVRTLRALLTLTRLDREGAFERSPVDLSALAADEADAVQPAADKKGLALTVDADASVRASGQPALLRKAVRNLLDNAVKYTREGGVRVDVGTTADGQARLTCTDTGVGMSDEECATATERFYRGTEAGRMAQGSGLGLSLIRRIVEEHDGELRLDSTPGEGTRVTIILPAPSSSVPSLEPEHKQVPDVA
ncbi:sensor histidine kinase [Salinibacter ruber]|uniref:sensor histidine kinase n=1 Tax=Salinibacter ruber TaxID=146919 RepID=UPI002168E65C|nr:HAMP domain-containing sensor histidine kinase [Salinibacter ruber]MCS4041144.1 signal transduction histidine kinase [Salinibacter ruber]